MSEKPTPEEIGQAMAGCAVMLIMLTLIILGLSASFYLIMATL